MHQAEVGSVIDKWLDNEAKKPPKKIKGNYNLRYMRNKTTDLLRRE